MKKLLLIDAHALVHRGYYAIKERYTGEGEQTNASFGFAQILLGLLEKEQPSHVAMAWEGGQSFRANFYPEYKSGRKTTPEDLVLQISRCREVADSLGIPSFSVTGLEGDDILGILANQVTTPADYSVVVATGDKDLLQLVNTKVTVMLPAYNQSKELCAAPGQQYVYYDHQAVLDRFGFRPDQMPDFKAIAGDPSDTIPGVKGLGEKGACFLIKKYGSVERMVKALVTDTPVPGGRVEEISKEEKKFINDWQAAVNFKRITTILKYHSALNVALDQLWWPSLPTNALIQYFQQLEFNELLSKVVAVCRINQGVTAPVNA